MSHWTEDLTNVSQSVRDRLMNTARLGQARISTRIDLGFGDAPTDPPVSTDLPVLLDFPPPHLRAYNAEAAVAEKLEAIVRFGTVNTRFKDFFDLYILSRERAFDADRLREQIQATFCRRKTDLPTAVPEGLGSEFGRSEEEEEEARAKKGTGSKAVSASEHGSEDPSEETSEDTFREKGPGGAGPCHREERGKGRAHAVSGPG